MAQNIIEVSNLSKRYGGVQALDNITLGFEEGKVHALLGENGAGKSTLIKILSGIENATSGEIKMYGSPVVIDSPIKAQSLGISTVYQEPSQAMSLSVSENIFSGRLPSNSLGILNKKKLESDTLELMDRINIHLNPNARLDTLSVAQRQMVEILKAVSYSAKFVIFDEPTSSLTKEETDILFSTIRALKKDGATILYISHRLEEIFSLCDMVTILRDGQFVTQQPLEELSQEKMISYMVGRSLENMYPKEIVEIGECILKVNNLNSAYVKDVSFSLNKGEILGFCGLVGSGRTEVARALFGIDRCTGEITLDGEQYHADRPWKAIGKGIALVPEDRKNEGLVQKLSIRTNIASVFMKDNNSAGVIKQKEELSLVNSLIERLRIRTPSEKQSVNNLSGGNQQKVVFAKWLGEDPKVLILDEPTRGVDVGAKTEIYSIIESLAKKGIGIIMISSEMPELIAMADRIMVMHEGSVSGTLDRKEFSEDLLMKLALKGAEK